MILKSFFRTVATRACVALALPIFPVAVFAQDKYGTNVDTAATRTPGAVGTAALAQELYALGLAQGDALTVLTAAKLAASVDVDSAEPAVIDPSRFTVNPDPVALAEKATSAAAPAAPAPLLAKDDSSMLPRAVGKATYFNAANQDEGAANAPVDAAAMMAKARDLAGDDETLTGLIADVEAEGPRGRTGGAVSWLSRLPSGQTDVWEVPFHGNSYAEVAVVGDGDANLDVAITDENGNVICTDTSWSDTLYCDFTPSWDGYFYVTVQNMGGSRNSYYLMTN